MDKHKLICEIDAYMRHIVFASDCLVAYKSVLDATTKYNAQINIAPGFFSVSLNSISKCLCVELSKLFLGSGDEKTMRKLINVVKANQNLFPKEKVSMCDWEDAPTHPSTRTIECINIAKDLQNAEIQLEQLQPILSRLKSRRDQFLVHNDPKYFDGANRPEWDFPISISDVQALIYFSAGFCNKLLSYLDNRVVAYRSTNADDLEQLLLHVQAN